MTTRLVTARAELARLEASAARLADAARYLPRQLHDARHAVAEAEREAFEEAFEALYAQYVAEAEALGFTRGVPRLRVPVYECHEPGGACLLFAYDGDDHWTRPTGAPEAGFHALYLVTLCGADDRADTRTPRGRQRFILEGEEGEDYDGMKPEAALALLTWARPIFLRPQLDACIRHGTAWMYGKGRPPG